MEMIHKDEGGEYVLIPVGKHHVKRYVKDIRRYRPGVFNPFLISKILEKMPDGPGIRWMTEREEREDEGFGRTEKP